MRKEPHSVSAFVRNDPSRLVQSKAQMFNLNVKVTVLLDPVADLSRYRNFSSLSIARASPPVDPLDSAVGLVSSEPIVSYPLLVSHFI